MSVLQLLRIGATGVLYIFVILWGFVQAFRGMVGSEDVSFLILRLSRNKHRKVLACTLESHKFKNLLENPYLNLRATMWLRKGILKAPNPTKQRRIMSPFVDMFSSIANERHGFDWAESARCRQTEYVFCVTSVKSSRGRLKIRAIAIRRKDYDTLKKEGVDTLRLAPTLEFMRDLLKRMIEMPEVLETFSSFRAIPRPKPVKAVVADDTKETTGITATPVTAA